MHRRIPAYTLMNKPVKEVAPLQVCTLYLTVEVRLSNAVVQSVEIFRHFNMLEKYGREGKPFRVSA